LLWGAGGKIFRQMGAFFFPPVKRMLFLSPKCLQYKDFQGYRGFLGDFGKMKRAGAGGLPFRKHYNNWNN